MTQRLDVLAGTPYTKDGEEKTRWTKIGAAFPEDNGGFSITLDALPLPQLYKGKLTCRLICRVPRDRDEPRQGGGGRSAPDDSRDIPF